MAFVNGLAALLLDTAITQP